MKKLFWILPLTILLMACHKDDDDNWIDSSDYSSMTVFAYLVADNNLNGVLHDNIIAMHQGLANMKQAGSLYIYWDGKTTIQEKDTPVILKYFTDGKGKVNGKVVKDKTFTSSEILDMAEIVKEYPDQNSTDKSVMKQVLGDMVGMVPNDGVGKIGLVAGSHASSWLPDYSRSRAFGDDEKNYIANSDMADAMSSTGRKFDFLLFDACLMGTAEVSYDFRNAANYMIVSALEIPSYGFPYDLMLQNLYEADVMGYQQACQTYLDFYRDRVKNNKSNSWGTISLIDNTKIASFANVFKEEIVSHKDMLRDYDLTQLQEYGKSSFTYVSVDSEQFIKSLNNNNVPTKFANSLKEVVLYTGCLTKALPSSYGVDEENYCGLGVYVPKRNKHDWNTYFKTTAWYKAAGWDEISFDWYF